MTEQQIQSKRIEELESEGYYVIKLDGLCGGKGVKVSGVDPELWNF